MEILKKVDKPARYIGGELNSYDKDLDKIDIHFAFAFPDVYEVAMSHLGMHILYQFLNRREDTFCERVFAPWVDMEEQMRKNQVELFGLESKTPLSKFDFVGFTLQYEMSYTNILNMLELANIPVFAEQRTDAHPLVIAGGPCAYNPEPLAPFVDFFYLGEGEVLYDEILDMYKQYKKEGKSKDQFLEAMLQIDGIYVPKFYEVEYNEDGTIKKRVATNVAARNVISKVVVNDMDALYYPDTQVIPWIQAVFDRVTLEMFRGCLRGCRFCQAGMIYRPVREKSKETLLKYAKNLIASTGYEEISLASLSTSDYKDLEEFVDELLGICSENMVNISLPSLRVDKFSLELMQKIQEVRKSSLTFAPEAGTQRLRDVINKNIVESEVLDGCRLAFSGGFSRVKLYFMLGLPTETLDDVFGIANLSEEVARTYYSLDKADRAGSLSLVVSTSCFVPKAFTPFQWEAQDTAEEFMKKHMLLKNAIKRKSIKYNHHDAKTSILEAVIARGDRRVANLIYEAHRLGCKFDGWSEHFKEELWLEAARISGVDFSFYAHRKRDYAENLPWDFIDIGVRKEFLIAESKKAYEGITTPQCREMCSGCGANKFSGGVCYEN
ncbi:TIGR03960 family B12-binding radical SAM protein [Candidatus Epulonipiscium viviparus]|uniref:TIGR03960 family B12-binding radical SAM protein n=1 Tax=Candidatus Epulonipiscium viviparus TaxID=420336 RepID=UPI0004967822|nr:TIGR03960 family B12-binding radical SAM protein [Candidatus Epulopiscium viviparus]